jgi:molybdopterin-binding protein
LKEVLRKSAHGTSSRGHDSHIAIDIGGGNTVTASITNEAVADLGLKEGYDVLAVIKASDVMVAK